MNVVTQFPATHDYGPDPRFQAMFEGAAIGIGICQLDGRILEANPALSKMLGYSQEELTGTHAGELYLEIRHGLFPELRCEAGREICSANLSQDERLLGELLRGERVSFQTEKRYRRKDGSELWGQLTVSLGRDPRRRPAFLIAMLADATERRRVDEHLRAAEKMEVIGRLAGGIAHDFNNLLTGVLLYCDLLSAGLENAGLENTGSENRRLESGGLVVGELRQHIEEVRLAGEQGAALTHQLLAIARKQAAEPRPVRINEVVASTENLLRRLIGEQIELVTALDSGAGFVLADPAQLRQILLNLALNARDAIPQGGKIRLITRATEFPGEFPGQVSSSAAPATSRRAVSLTVKDNGCGMDAETRARLFEPFFTTKKPGEGTGLGLATVERIVSESGGLIEVESELGHGTSIEVFLPAIEPAIIELAIDEAANQTSPTVARPDPEVADGTIPKTILLVDDHAATRKSMQSFLRDAGYQILAASCGQQALEVFAKHSVDLLIADCMMPRMNGQELAKTLLRQKPGLKVLLISGYQEAPVEAAVGAVELIRKPFSGKALIERVVQVLDRR
jgi:signal transduction histidine kinase